MRTPLYGLWRWSGSGESGGKNKGGLERLVVEGLLDVVYCSLGVMRCGEWKWWWMWWMCCWVSE